MSPYQRPGNSGDLIDLYPDSSSTGQDHIRTSDSKAVAEPATSDVPPPPPAKDDQISTEMNIKDLRELPLPAIPREQGSPENMPPSAAAIRPLEIRNPTALMMGLNLIETDQIPPPAAAGPLAGASPESLTSAPNLIEDVSKENPASESANEKSEANFEDHQLDSKLGMEIESDQQNDETSRPEIRNIMDQFDGEGGGPDVKEVMSPRLELASPLLPSPHAHPPRKSSLEPIRSSAFNQGRPPVDRKTSTDAVVANKSREAEPERPDDQFGSRLRTVSPESQDNKTAAKSADLPPVSDISKTHLPAPPEPDPEPDLPFDFHRFLEQLRHRTADPVAKFLRSFLLEFAKKQWMVHEQVKIVSDFLAFITDKMARCEVWRGVSDPEFDNAREGMEKLVMNRLYTQTFSPEIPPPQVIMTPKGKRRQGERIAGPGRKGQHQEDVERDDVLAQKIRIYGWVKAEHLDIIPIGDSGKRFLTLAQQELVKIKSYRAPRDKIICVLNCCKVIFGVLKNLKSDQSADSFFPLLIYVVLHANPEHLVSNVQYILRFRNQEKLGGEAGYYLSSLMSAIQFIEGLDRTSLTISDDEFERNVEAAVSAIAERHNDHNANVSDRVQVSEKSTISRPEVTPRNSLEVEWSTPRLSTSSREGVESAGDGGDDKAAIAGLLRTIQKPLSTIGRIFSEDGASSASDSAGAAGARRNQPALTPQPGATPRLSPAVPGDGASPTMDGQGSERARWTAENAAARQASAETAEARRIQRAEHADVVETLSGMFPGLDKEVIDDVVRMKEGRVGLAVDACLALNS